MSPTAPSDQADTPLMRQYRALKARYPQAVLFFRLGDFFEMFGEDARAAAPVLGLVLTHRQGLPMCGVPHHAASQHIAKLLAAGMKVAIADQVEDPAQAKGIVRREVVRLITPGTLVEDELLEAGRSNYLAAVELDHVGWGLAWLDASTGEFWATQALNDPGARGLLALLSGLEPAEVLGSEKAVQELKGRAAAPSWTAVPEPPRAAAPAHWPEAEGWAGRPLAVRAALRAERYIAETEPRLRPYLAPRFREPFGHLQLDETAIRTLELVASPSGQKRFTLWGALDRCRTPMGSRRLKDWILRPLLDAGAIGRRHDAVGELVEDRAGREELGEALSGISDLERVLHRLATPSAGPRDLAALRESLHALPSVHGRQAGEGSRLAELFGELRELGAALAPLADLLSLALSDAPPARLSDGGLIRDGWNPELDELRGLKRDSKGTLSRLEARERERSGIEKLKVGYNSVFGYYFELSKANAAKAPADWTRKQTLVNAERYISPELKQLETKLLSAEERIGRLEGRLFEELKKEALARHAPLRDLAARLSELDVYYSLARAAFEGDYVRPKVTHGTELEIEDGRHPVVERTLPAGAFVPNDLRLDGLDPQIVVLTGPNMSGKSTYLRQNALIALMAQLGSFVPAKAARVGVLDRILTRIGSQDALARGDSTFMVEMRETAFILASASSRSLVILDEVGRGTSTYDGISIAWAVLEHLHSAYRSPVPEHKRPDGGPGPKVLFATHYFELTALPDRLPGVVNFNVEAREWTNAEGKSEVVFLHKIAKGPADRSYGIHVAELAGLPAACVERARGILRELEKGEQTAPAAEGDTPMLPMFGQHPVLDELKVLHPEKMTPLEALQKLVDWKRKA